MGGKVKGIQKKEEQKEKGKCRYGRTRMRGMERGRKAWRAREWDGRQSAGDRKQEEE